MRLAFLIACLVCAFASSAPALEPPAFQQGGAWFGAVAPGSSVILDGREVRVSEAGRFVIGFGRDHGPDAELVVVHPDGVRETLPLAIARRAYDVQRIDGLPASKVTPPDDVIARIIEERDAIAAVRAVDTPVAYFADPAFSPEPVPVWPAAGWITGVYGSQRVLNGEPRQPHFGIDIANATGTPVIAPLGGRVVYAHDMYFSGLTLVIDHGHGLTSSFLHLSEIAVEPGQLVRQGERIAAMGATGRVTGPHLDWRMNWFAERIDPAALARPFTPLSD